MLPVDNAGWRPVGRDDGHRYSATTLSIFWPDAEHRKLIARWPHLAAAAGATWDEHRQQIERHCALVERTGYTVTQVSGTVTGLKAFLADRRVTTPSSEDLRGYPDLRSRPTTVGWPPARTGPSWCGSGRRYKQCCRPHGLGSLD